MDIPNIGKDRKKLLKGSPDLSNLIYGKVPPQARELEEAILGAVMTSQGAFDTASGIIGPECFYVDAHRRIFKAFCDLRNKYSPIDSLTVVEQLRKSDELDIIGGAYAVVKLTNGVTGAAHLDAHCKIIYQKFLQREMIRMCGEVIGMAYEDSTDAFELIESHSLSVNQLSLRNSGKEYAALMEVAEKAIEQIRKIKGSDNALTGAPSGILKLDHMTQGFQPTDLVIIAARPGIGKTAVAANVARGAAFHPIKPTPVGVFSLEMSSSQWVKRLITAESEIDGMRIKRGEITDQEMQNIDDVVYKRFINGKIFFDDTASLTIAQLKNKARKMVLKNNVGLIIVDYMQLVSSGLTKAIREQEVSMISRELKQLAKELNVPVITLSQLNRAGDNNNPQLKDLRESGAIEQDADMVIFLIPGDESGNSEDPMIKDTLLIRIAKFRDGAIDDMPCRYVKSIQKIFGTETEYENYIGAGSFGSLPGKWQPVKNYYEIEKETGATGFDTEPF